MIAKHVVMWMTLLVPAAIGQVDVSERPPLTRLGAEVPRPVDGELRAQLGFPPPRATEEILAAIDELTLRMEPIAAEDAIWKQRWQDYRAMQRTRVSLVSELEESGYDGERLEALLRMKLEDVDGAAPGVSAWSRLRHEMASRHPDTPIAAEARALAMLENLQGMLGAGFRVHPGDYRRIAEIELGWKHHELAGTLILEALHFADDPELEAVWHDWIVENLPASSRGHRWVTKQRGFGQPIRLAGECLDGKAIDTGEWRGDVILVDFWGMWCVPCREAMPRVKAALERHRGDGLRVLGVLCDHELDKARGFLSEHGYGWPQLVDRSLTPADMMHPIAKRYAVGAFPTLWVIDRAGVLRERITSDELDDKLTRYLAEPRPDGKD